MLKFLIWFSKKKLDNLQFLFYEFSKIAFCLFHLIIIILTQYTQQFYEFIIIEYRFYQFHN